MLHTIYQRSEASSSVVEDFFLHIFYGSKTKTSVAEQFWILGPSFDTSKSSRHCFIPYFKYLSQVVLKKKLFEYFSMYLYGSSPRPIGRRHFSPRGHHLQKQKNVVNH